jgi:hypothetical protein
VDAASPFTMRLRAGKSSDLEFVTLDQQDLTKETCVQAYTVEGNQARMVGSQTCTLKSTSIDPDTQEEVTTESVEVYSDDEMTLSGNTLHETGAVDTTPEGKPCHTTFTVDYEKL